MEGLGHDTDGEDALLLGGSRDDGARRSPCRHPCPVMKPCANTPDDRGFRKRFLCRSGTVLRLGAAPTHVKAVPIWMRRCARSASAPAHRICYNEFNAFEPALDHIVDGVATRSADTEDGNAVSDPADSNVIDCHDGSAPDLICQGHLSYSILNKWLTRANQSRKMRMICSGLTQTQTRVTSGRSRAYSATRLARQPCPPAVHRGR